MLWRGGVEHRDALYVQYVCWESEKIPHMFLDDSQAFSSHVVSLGPDPPPSVAQ